MFKISELGKLVNSLVILLRDMLCCVVMFILWFHLSVHTVIPERCHPCKGLSSAGPKTLALGW